MHVNQQTVAAWAFVISLWLEGCYPSTCRFWGVIWRLNMVRVNHGAAKSEKFPQKCWKKPNNLKQNSWRFLIKIIIVIEMLPKTEFLSSCCSNCMPAWRFSVSLLQQNANSAIWLQNHPRSLMLMQFLCFHSFKRCSKLNFVVSDRGLECVEELCFYQTRDNLSRRGRDPFPSAALLSADAAGG